ncbi:hypothetical protein CSC04_0196 [Enterobacter roggenkampii]|nr:hypothetical protein CSC04_0196 [Enterobacter roggenkampii]
MRRRGLNPQCAQRRDVICIARSVPKIKIAVLFFYFIDN